MNLKALIAAAAVSTALFGGAATAEAKPHEKKAKKVKKDSLCPRDYTAVDTVELGPGSEASDLNGNFILCYSAVLGVVDDAG